jgi:hypothetical protein
LPNPPTDLYQPAYSTSLLSQLFITLNTMAFIKKELFEDSVPFNNSESLQPEIPPNFQPNEWIEMTGVIITTIYHNKS